MVKCKIRGVVFFEICSQNPTGIEKYHFENMFKNPIQIENRICRIHDSSHSHFWNLFTNRTKIEKEVIENTRCRLCDSRYRHFWNLSTNSWSHWKRKSSWYACVWTLFAKSYRNRKTSFLKYVQESDSNRKHIPTFSFLKFVHKSH